MTKEKQIKILKKEGINDSFENFEVVETENHYEIYEFKRGEIRGCLLVGDGYKDINGDGLLDVVNSRRTLETLVELIREIGGEQEGEFIVSRM